MKENLKTYKVKVSTNHLRTRLVVLLAASPEDAAICAPEYFTYRPGERAVRVNPKLEVELVKLS